mgnify:CR=1 FL=1
MKICLVGEGAFANKHIDAIARIEDVEVSVICGGVAETTEAVANARGIPFYTTDLAEALNQPGVDAAILATPTGLHAAQAIQVMRSGKHVLIEIPMADNLADAQKLVEVQQETGLVAMVDHVRRFNPSHQWIHNKIKSGELQLQQLDVQTYFFRRENINALGQPRHSSWEKKREMDEPSEISSWFKPGSVQYMSSHTVEDGCSPATPERAWRTYSSLDVLGRPPPPTTSSSSASSHEGERAGATEASARTSRGSSASRGASRATHARDRPRPTPGTGVRTSRATFGDLSSPGTFRAPGVTRCAGLRARRNRTPPAPMGATSETAMFVLSASAATRARTGAP